MRRYDSYKDSGVEWIGEIPEEWEVKRLKYSVKMNPETLPENTDKDYEIQYIDIGNVEQGQLKLPPEELKFGLAPSRARRIIKFGDTIVSTVRTYLKAITYINSDLTNIICSTGFAVLRADADLNGKYIFYVASTPQIIEEICSLSVGVSYPAISPSALGNINIWLPPLPEQTAIASFLDRKTAEIDQLIANKEKLIALYEEEKTAIINRAVTRGLDPAVKTRPSGVDWLGDIPEHWEVKRLKRLCSIISKGTTPSTVGREILPVGDIRFIKAENVLNNRVVAEPANFIDQKTNEMICRSQLEGSDILFVIAGATIGKVAILPLEFCPANTNQAVSFIRLKNKETVLFVWYWLQSDFIKKVLWLDAVQSAQPNLSMENLGNFYVPFPSLPEQTAIVTHIETECARLDAIIEKFKKQIELFKEYRTTLISEVVTGKIDVRGEVGV